VSALREVKPDWYSNVQPKRRVREARTEFWVCRCTLGESALRPPYLVACPDCGERRPS